MRTTLLPSLPHKLFSKSDKATVHRHLECVCVCVLNFNHTPSRINVSSLGLIKTNSNECLLICLCTCVHTLCALLENASPSSATHKHENTGT